MNKGFISLILVIIAILFFSNADALEIWQLVGHEMLQPQDFTAASYAMGGLTTAGARGADAVLSNPAGMALDLGKGAEILITSRMYIMGKPPQYDEDVYEGWGKNDISYKVKFHTNYLSNIVFYAPYRFPDAEIDIGGGIAWRRYYDFSGKIIQTYERLGDEEEINLKMSSSLNFLTFSGAVSYQGKYSAGLLFGFPLMSGHEGDSTYENKGTGYELEGSEKAKLSGSLIRFGTVIQPVPVVAFGFAFTGGFEMKSDDIEWEWEDSDGFSDEGEDPDVDIEIPGFISVGLAWMPNDVVTLGFEYQTRPWEDIEVNGVEFWDGNGFSLRVGGNFDLEAVALRVGYIMDKGHFVDEDEEPISVHTITGGLGFGTQTFSVDIGLGYSMSSWELGEDLSYNLFQTRLGVSYNLPFFKVE